MTMVDQTVNDSGCHSLIIKYSIPLAEFQIGSNFYAVLFNFRCAIFLFYQTHASTKEFTYYFPHSRRGKVAIDEAGILPSYRGVAIHDHWEAYNSYPSCAHVFCNCHHLRELTQVSEQEGALWAKEMKELLLEIKEQVDRAKDALVDML